MYNKNLSNNFIFSLHQNDVLLFEGVIDAGQFNPYTRNSIDIRSILPKIITTLQKTLSKKSYDVEVELGREIKDVNGKDDLVEKTINLYHYNQKMINDYPQYMRSEMYYNPKPVTHEIEDKVIKGVECKIGLYVNDNTIVEREFYVDGFNPVSRWSVDLTGTCEYIVELISDHIKNSDVNNMWDDYDLINKAGYSINQIRELPEYKRRSLLNKISKY